jgi:hypothetical protein
MRAFFKHEIKCCTSFFFSALILSLLHAVLEVNSKVVFHLLFHSVWCHSAPMYVVFNPASLV